VQRVLWQDVRRSEWDIRGFVVNPACRFLKSRGNLEERQVISEASASTMADDQNMGGDRENQQLEKLKALKPVKYLSSLPPSLIKHTPPTVSFWVPRNLSPSLPIASGDWGPG
jgi:hypothetical protein